jgi:hypothetical protein
MLDKNAEKFTRWIGSPSSIVVHTIIFIFCFLFVWFGVDLEKMLLVLTTVVSLEAIYLAIFIQMTVNRNTESLEEVEEDIDEIQGDMTEIQEDIDEIQDTVIDEESDNTKAIIDSVHSATAHHANGNNPEKHRKLQIIKQNLDKILAELEELKKDH